MLPAALAGLTALFLAAAIYVFARRRPDYSHWRHTLSELGEVGARDQRLVGWGVFLPVGLALAGVALAAKATSLPHAALAGCIAVGYLVAAFFPCDPQSPLSGTPRQGVHNLGGAVEYIGGALSLLWLAESQGPAFRVLGLTVGATAILLSFPSPLRGLIQRIGETALFGGLVWALALAS